MPSGPLSPLEQLRSAIGRGEITPPEAVEQALACANTNASKNVYLTLDANAALRQADELARRFTAERKPLLYGLPISLKDCFDLAGFTTTCGSRFYAARNGAAQQDSAVAARLRSLERSSSARLTYINWPTESPARILITVIAFNQIMRGG